MSSSSSSHCSAAAASKELVLKTVHVCKLRSHDLHLTTRDIVLDDQIDIVCFKCPKCGVWKEHDVCSSDFFWTDYRDVCHVVSCNDCGVFVTDVILGSDENVMRFDSVKDYAFLDRKLEAKFRKKYDTHTRIDLFNLPLVKVDAYCNVADCRKICKDQIVERPACYNVHELEGVDFDVSFVRRQPDQKFVMLASD